MNKTYLLLGGAAVAAIVGFQVIKGRNAAQAQASQDSGSNPVQPVYYATGFGANTVAASDVTGATADNSFAQIADALKLKSNNDLSLGLAGIDANKTIGLASINADLQTQLTQLGNSRLSTVFNNIGNMQKYGISAINGNVSNDGSVSSSVLYTDPTKNVSLVTGYNGKGDTTTTFGTINKQASQSIYDMGTYTDIYGKKQNNSGLPGSAPTPTPLVAKPVTNPLVYVSPGASNGYTQGIAAWHGLDGTITGNNTVQ